MEIEPILISQYRAALRMLCSAVDACPESLWIDGSVKNRFWHVAYHALYYTHLYLGRSPETFTPWEKARPDHNYLGPMPRPPHEEPKIGDPYTKAEIAAYGDLVATIIAPSVRAVPLDDPSGFPWLPFDRLELHIYNIRHTQHHAGQLIDRLRDRCGIGVAWVGMQNEDRPKTEGS